MDAAAPTSEPNRTSAQQSAARAALGLCGLIIAAGLVVLMGWSLNFSGLKSVFPQYITMKANTAFGIICLACATALTVHGRAMRHRRGAYALILLTLVMAGLTLAEYALDIDMGIDQILFVDAERPDALSPPGRLAPITGVCFIILGVGLAAQTYAGRIFARLSRFLLLLALLLAFQALVGYLLGTSLFGAAFYTQMAVHTAVLFVMLGCAMLLAQRAAHRSLRVDYDGADRVMLRRLFAGAVVVPPLVQWLVQAGKHAGYFSDDSGVMMQVLGNTGLLLTVIGSSLRTLHGHAARMRQSEQDFIQVAEAVPQIIWAAQPNGALDYCNENGYRYTGFSRQDTPPEKWSMALHPDDAATVKTLWKTSLKSGLLLQIECRLLRYDKVYRWHLLRAAPTRNETGDVVRWFGTYTDIDDMKALDHERTRLRSEHDAAQAIRDNEARMRILLEGAFDAVIGMDSAGLTLTWNAKAEKMFGWTKSEALGQPVSHLVVPPALRKAHRHGLQRYLNTRVETLLNREVELEACCKDGSLLPVRLYITPVDLGATVHFTAFITDMTERRRTEAELKAAQLHAEQATSAKSQFLAHMSHEVRTPLNGVLGITDMLLDTHLTPEQHAWAEIIRDSGKQLLTIVNDVLDFSKVEAGRVALELAAFDLRKMVRQQVQLLAGRAEAKKLQVEIAVHPLVPEALLGDAGRIGQVLLNVLSNAIKFTDVGTIDVCVTPHGQSYRFSVQDHGLGIAPEARSRLFQPFTQADSSTSRKYGGTGLGLSICRRLVEHMGGCMDFTSAPGQGSLFWFDLPLPEAPAPESQGPETPAEPVVAPHIPGRAIQVLVAEDNRVNQMVVQAHLRKLGCEICLVTNGREAVETFKQASFDIILMDCHMPEMDGFTATAQIRLYEAGLKRHTPIIALTASALAEDVLKCLHAGMDAHLCKPIRLEDFAAMLRKYFAPPTASL